MTCKWPGGVLTSYFGRLGGVSSIGEWQLSLGIEVIGCSDCGSIVHDFSQSTSVLSGNRPPGETQIDHRRQESRH